MKAVKVTGPAGIKDPEVVEEIYRKMMAAREREEREAREARDREENNATTGKDDTTTG